MRFLILPLLFISLFTFPQSGLIKIYPQSPPPSPFMDCISTKLVKTSDGGYLASYNPYAGNIHSGYPIGYHLLKLDSSLVPQWKRDIYSLNLSLASGNNIISYKSGWNSRVEKINNSGQVIWSKEIGFNYPYNIAINDLTLVGSNIKLVGYHSKEGIMPFTYAFYRGIIIEMDTLGNILKSETYDPGSAPFLYFNKIKIDGSGNSIILADGKIFKFSSSGSLLWSNSFSGTYIPSFYDAEISNSGDIYACGGYYNGTNTTICIMKLNSAGALSWVKSLQHPGTARGIQQLNNGNYLVASMHANFYGDALHPLLFEMDNSGNVIWSKRYFKSLGISDIYKKSNNEYLVSSYFNGPMIFNVDSMGSYGCNVPLHPITFTAQPIGMMVFPAGHDTITLPSVTGPTVNLLIQTVRDTCILGIGISETKSNDIKFDVYPNPSSGKIYITSKHSIINCKIIDILGNEILNNKVNQLNVMEIKLNEFIKGFFFLYIETEDGWGVKKVILE